MKNRGQRPTSTQRAAAAPGVDAPAPHVDKPDDPWIFYHIKALVGIVVATATFSGGIAWTIRGERIQGLERELQRSPRPSQETIEAIYGTTNQPGLPFETAVPTYHGNSRLKLKFNGGMEGFQKMLDGNIARFFIVPMLNLDLKAQPISYQIFMVFSNRLQAYPLVATASINGVEIVDETKIKGNCNFRYASYEIHQEIPRGAVVELIVKPRQ